MEYNLSTKQTKTLQKYDLMNLSKEELVDKLLISQAHNNQLRNIITKQKNKTTIVQKSKTKSFDFTRIHFRHVLLNFYYLGWDYQGFVIQEDTFNTIEHYLFEALIKTCLIKDRESSNYHRCGRTDKGVSSFGQTISISIRSKLSKENEQRTEQEINYCKILNSVLPNSIQCIAWCPVPQDFSARFNCKSRTYKYFFPKGTLNIDAMQESLVYLVGIHDFRNFCKMDVANGVVTFIRNIFDAHIGKCTEVTENNPYDMFQLTIKGQAFLWHQIRCIIAVLFLIGENKESPEIIKELLDITKCTRKPNYNLAKDLPLNLFRCEYNDIPNWVYDFPNLSHIIHQLQKLWTYSSVKSTMMKTMIDELEKVYKNQKFEENPVHNVLTSSLVQGVDSKIYKPLMTRQKCNALDDRIEHYKKKRKLPISTKDANPE